MLDKYSLTLDVPTFRYPPLPPIQTRFHNQQNIYYHGPFQQHYAHSSGQGGFLGSGQTGIPYQQPQDMYLREQQEQQPKRPRLQTSPELTGKI